MRRIIGCLLLCVLLSSCGLFRRVEKTSTTDKINTSLQVRTDSNAHVVDRSVTTVTEKVDTVVQVPGKSVVSESPFNIDSLIAGITAIKSDLVDVRLLYDQKTGMLRTDVYVKPSTVLVAVDRMTVRANDIVTDAHVTSSKESTSSVLHKTGHVIKEPKNTFWYVVLMFGVTAIIALFVYKRSGGK